MSVWECESVQLKESSWVYCFSKALCDQWLLITTIDPDTHQGYDYIVSKACKAFQTRSGERMFGSRLS